jgi:nicotinamide-nucleotide amidase
LASSRYSQMSNNKVELLAIGNELLIGQVHDSNLFWLSQKLTNIGALVWQAYIVRDDMDAIGEVVRLALSHHPRLIITSGGLGPTWDDITVSALGRALGREVRLDPVALEMVRKRYEEVKEAGFVPDATLTPERKKMAYLPEGAVPLHNPVGTAPGVLITEGDTNIVALPGVPPEMRGIFETSLQPYLKEWFSGKESVQWGVLIGQGESTIASIVNDVAKAYPDVYVKSRARIVDGRAKVLVTLTVHGEERRSAMEKLNAARRDLMERLRNAGVPVLEEGDDLPFRQEI